MRTTDPMNREPGRRGTTTVDDSSPVVDHRSIEQLGDLVQIDGTELGPLGENHEELGVSTDAVGVVAPVDTQGRGVDGRVVGDDDGAPALESLDDLDRR